MFSCCHQDIGQLAAQTQRLAALFDILDEINGDHEGGDKASKIVRIEDAQTYLLQLESLSFTTPNGNQIITDSLDLSQSNGMHHVFEESIHNHWENAPSTTIIVLRYSAQVNRF